jgi:F-type H+-transporting ATPase subunit b
VRTKLFFIFMICLCSVLYASDAGGGQEEGINPFSGGFADALWTVITFVVLLAALWKIVWKKLLEGLTARADYIQKQITDAERKKADAESVLAQYNDKLADADNQGQKIIESHIKKAQAQSKDITEKARTDIEIIRKKAEIEIEAAKKRAHDELLTRFSGIILDLGSEVIGRNINDEDNQRLIDKALGRLKTEQAND